MNNKTLQVKEPISELQPANDLQAMVDIEVKNRQILTKFITDHMKDKVDYGKIHMNKSCQNKYDCTLSYHFSKPCLFKPGAEKFTSLMKLTAVFARDMETWEMLGSKAGTVCFVCYLKDQKGLIVGEGRGCATIAEKGSENTTTKIAEKRAKMDAVLSTGGLSDFFTQDLEDMTNDSEIPEKQVSSQPSVSRAMSTPITIPQKTQVMILLGEKGKTMDDLVHALTAFKKTLLKDLTAKEADTLIAKLQSLPDRIEKDAEVDIDAIPENLGI